MIYTIQEEGVVSKVKYLLHKMIPDEDLFGLDPIIAGGAALSALKTARLHDSNQKWSEFTNALDNIPFRIRNIMCFDYGDVDCWFMNNNKIFKPDSKYNFLVQNYTNLEVKTWNEKSKGFRDLYIANSTKWANTYNHVGDADTRRIKPNNVVQIIKKPAESVEDLIDNFDISLCSVAYHNEVIYMSNDVDNAFKNFELRMGKGFYDKKTLSSKVYSVLRCFKYSKRYGLHFDRNMTEQIFNIYLKANQRISELIDDSDCNVYPSGYDTFHNMVKNLNSNFKYFSNMKYFKREYCIYLLDKGSEIFHLENILSNSETSSYSTKGVAF